MAGMDPTSEAKVFREVLRSYTYVIIWMSISIAVILFNKWLLAYSGFPFPIALTMWHMFFCSFVGFLAVRVFKVVKSHNMSAQEYYMRVMPIGLLYAGSLWLSNSAYLYLSVSFIQMTKSLMPGLVYASGCLVGTEQFTRGVAANMSLIAFGVLVCAYGEMNLVIKGLVQQLAALAFEAMRLTLVQVLINSKGLNMNPMQSLYYVSPACLLGLLLPFAAVELPRMRAATNWHVNPSVLLANALAAFALNLAVFLLIGKTSALTMNIAGVIKDWMLIFFSFYLFRAPVTRTNLLGYVFCCSGVVVYNHMKLKAIKAKVAAESSNVDSSAAPKGGKGATAGGGSGRSGGGKGRDEEAAPLVQRTKDDILSEMRRLQGEMAALDGRVGASAKLVQGLHGSGEPGPVSRHAPTSASNVSAANGTGAGHSGADTPAANKRE